METCRCLALLSTSGRQIVMKACIGKYANLIHLNQSTPNGRLSSYFTLSCITWKHTWICGKVGHSDNHSQRNRYIRETEEFREIWPAYSYLYRLSINARYESMSFSAEEVRGLEANQFNFIKQHVRSLIGA